MCSNNERNIGETSNCCSFDREEKMRRIICFKIVNCLIINEVPMATLGVQLKSVGIV